MGRLKIKKNYRIITLVIKSKLTYLYAMGLPKQLSEQQKKFAELLVYNEGRKTPTECALEAGYAEGSAHVRASELRNANKYPLVVKYIGELREEIQKKYEITFENTSQNSVVYAKKLWLKELSQQLQMRKLQEEKQQDSISNRK